MKDRDPASPPRGILHGTAPGPWEHRRYLPAPALRPFVEHFWTVHWQLDVQPQHIVQTLPHPSVHVVFESGKPLEICGVQRSRFVRSLSGCGQVFGIKFRPGGFHPFYQRSMATLTDRVLPLDSVLGERALDWHAAMVDAADDAARMCYVESLLLARQPEPTPTLNLVQAASQEILEHAHELELSDLCTRLAIKPRTLQHLFREHVGIGPKWMLQRYRLHEALARLDLCETPNWSAFALALGYFDQAHFNRDFRSMTGMTPTQYRTQALMKASGNTLA